MRNSVFAILIIIAAFVFCLAATAGKNATPGSVAAPAGGGKPGATVSAPAPTGPRPAGGPMQFFRAKGENCYLVFSNFGIFGGHNFQEDYGFHYDIGTFFPPERYAGLYSWTEAPTLASYNDFVDSTTTLPFWLQLPSGATLSVQYRAKWDIEVDFDGVELEIATVGEPTNWKNLRPTSTVRGSGQIGQPDTSRYYYEGAESDWSLETVDVSSYAGKQVKLRFHFRSDMSNRDYYHGIYVDEFKILRDGNTEVYYNGFENKGTDDWQTEVSRGDPEEDAWGFSEALPAEMNFLSNGEFIAGASTSYVADAFVPDWNATSVGWTKVVNYSNEDTRSSGQPEFRVDQFVYPYADFVIVDCYVKNGLPQTQGNVYSGVRMNISIRHDPYERDDDERVTYVTSRRMAMFYDDGQLDQPVCGLAYFDPDDDPPASVNFTSVVDEWTDDSTNYTNMSNGQYDYQDVPSPKNRWVVVVGQGPETLPMSEVSRFTFAIIGGDDEDDLLANADQARNIYQTLPDKTPVSITPTSFGKIKSLFR